MHQDNYQYAEKKGFGSEPVQWVEKQIAGGKKNT